jgi:hypothetical protein
MELTAMLLFQIGSTVEEVVAHEQQKFKTKLLVFMSNNLFNCATDLEQKHGS